MPADASYNLNGRFKPTTKRSADLDGLDFYPTPAWTMRSSKMSGLRATSGNVPAGTALWRKCLAGPGCGSLALTCNDRGFGEPGHDFLTSSRRVANIITNPPFHSAEGFVAQCVKLAEVRFALLLRLAFLEGANRTRTVFHKHPPARVWVFSERITFYPKGAKMAGSGTTAYAWFVWDKTCNGPTELRWFNPGYKAKF